MGGGVKVTLLARRGADDDHLAGEVRRFEMTQHVEEATPREGACAAAVVDPRALEALRRIPGEPCGDSSEALEPVREGLGALGPGEADRLVDLAVRTVGRDRERGVADARRKVPTGTAEDHSLSLAVDPRRREHELRTGAFDRGPQGAVAGRPGCELEVVRDDGRPRRAEAIDHARVDGARDAATTP